MGGEGILSGGDSHKSNVTPLGQMFDAASWFTPDEINPHTYINPATDWLNEQLSVVSKPLNQFGTMITPGKAWIDKNVPIAQQWNETVENRPVDAMGIVASLFGGAAAGGAGGAGATGAGTGGTLGSAGSTAATSALTPTFSSGAGMAASAAPSALQLSAGAGGTGIGTLGSAGTTAALNGLTPAFASQGAATGTGSYLGNLYDRAKDLYGQGKEIKSYYDRGRQVYDLMNPDQPQQDLNQPLELNNPYAVPNDPRRFLRGY